LKHRIFVAFTAVLIGLSMIGSAAAQSVGGTDLVSVDLDTGAATRVGMVGDGLSLIGLAVFPDGSAVALTIYNELVGFSLDDPGTVTSSVAISGLGKDAALVGIDVRPATGEIIAISDTSVLYVVDRQSAVATAIGDSFSPSLELSSVGFDFNPTVDRIRVDVRSGQNLRLNPETGQVGTNPDTGAPTIDGRLAFAEGDANSGAVPNVVAAGYTNSVADAEETELYVIDSALDVLAVQDPPNDGVLNTVGSLGVDFDNRAAFDITPSGDAFALVPSDSLPNTGAGTSASATVSQLPMLLLAAAGALILGTAGVGVRARAK